MCEMCNGQLSYLGALGNRYQYRCINCGMTSSSETPPEEMCPEEEAF